MEDEEVSNVSLSLFLQRDFFVSTCVRSRIPIPASKLPKNKGIELTSTLSLLRMIDTSHSIGIPLVDMPGDQP